MTNASSLLDVPDLTAEDYLVVGLATCFIKVDGEVHEVKVVEPIPSAALEAIAKGIPTSYELACATTIGEVLEGETPKLPRGFPPESQFCDEFNFRVLSVARTYKARPASQEMIPTGTTRTDFNYSTERKRVLNSERIVRAEDNVKQHEYTHKVL